MCGIAGFYGAGDQADLEAMTNALVHRGPDDFGFFTSGALKLGHRRLSIVDLAMGQQPMVDPESGLVIVYNGELYNHLELRERLKREGQVFRTSHSDTETVLRSFLVWGSSCFALFNGMFALAIYDPRKQKLWLARDRFGEKPLFYTKNAQGFAFASELGALQLWPHFNSKLDYGNLQRFFGWGYLPAGRTIYQGCQALLPGSFLSFDLKSFELRTESYWQFELCPDESLNSVPEEELVGELRELLVKAVQRRLLADVPLGVFLSGGLDSSCVLAAAAKCLPVEQISAFSIGFTEPSFDESNNAREVATHLGTKHFVSMLTQEDLLNRAPEILKNMSEPLGDASLIPTEHLAAFAREKVTVALSGDGGDELFAGYDPFKALKPAALYRKVVPRPCHALLRAALSLIPSSDRNMSLEFKLKRALRGLSYPSGLELPVWMGPLEPAEL
ncbi:MAG: asparagine synthase (glutamine-hydrolyzing), partial [Desulfovibrio sp.]|nr:asparagine synthase (glutamine-hydrolyzing) [Desulfovibrio sp.]